MVNNQTIIRTDLVGKTGEITSHFEIIEANEDKFGINIRIKDSFGEVYWTSVDSHIEIN